MYYIVVVNDIKSNSRAIIKSEEVVEKLFEKKYWLFNNKHPIKHRIKKLRKNDKVILYMAGKNRGYFYASFTITGEVLNINLISGLEEIFYKKFSFAVPIGDIKIFDRPIHVKELLNKLIFINDTQYWGIFFKQSLKLIDAKDYNTIISYSEKKRVVV